MPILTTPVVYAHCQIFRKCTRRVTSLTCWRNTINHPLYTTTIAAIICRRHIQQQLLQSSIDAITANTKSFDCTSPSTFVSILPLLVQKPVASTGPPFPPPRKTSVTNRRTDVVNLYIGYVFKHNMSH